MDDQRGLGHVMDIRENRRSVYSIKQSPTAYADLYLKHPKLWSSDIYLSCVPFSDKLKDLFWIGNEAGLYLALKLPFHITATIKVSKDESTIGHTLAERLLLNSNGPTMMKFNIFLQPIAYGQLITNLLEIPGVMPKDKIYEIVIFNIVQHAYNLEFFLQLSIPKKHISPNVYWFWQEAFKSLNMVHINNLKIGRCEAKNAFVINDGSKKLVKWIDSSQSDTLLSSQPLVKNMKRLLDINRLLLDNSFVWSLASNSVNKEVLYNDIYTITQEKVPQLESVIFFSSDFILVDDYSWTDISAKMTYNTPIFTDAEIVAFLTLIYNKENVKKRTDIPKLEKFIENVKAIKFDEVFEYLTTRLDSYAQLLQVNLLQKNTQNLKSSFFLPWLFESKQLSIKTSQGPKIGPIFINSLDKKLYVTIDNTPEAVPSTQCYLETTNEEVRTKHGDMLVFFYNEDHADIQYAYDGEQRYIQTDKLQNETNLKLFPKTSRVYSDSPHHSQSTPLPRVMPTREIHPLEKNRRYFISYDNDIVLALIVDNHYCQLAYQINDDNSIQFFYGFGDLFEPFNVSSIINVKAFGVSKEGKWKVIVDTVFSFEYPFIVFTTNGQFNRKVNLLFMRQP